jgi:Mg-chelatase subunit ChlD
MSGSAEVPPAFICAITTEVMEDPVTDRDGHSYERSAIAKWVAEHGTSPITRNAMTVDDLVPNRALHDAIHEWFVSNGRAAPRSKSAAAATKATSAAAAATVTPIKAQFTACAAPSRAIGEPDAADSDLSVMLTVTPPERATWTALERLPCDLVCVLDTSGSMDDETVAKDADGSTEQTGLSILDVVKHSVLTMAEMLGPKDRLAIVNFANAATSRPFVNMDDAGRVELKKLLDTLRSEGGTNLWSGIQAGMDIACTSTRNCSVFVLTDGRPTTNPPRGYEKTLERHLEQFQGPAPFTVSTFGFGYQLDADILDQLAKTGNGTFSFIPDGGLVGTVFVNAAANLLATFAQSARIKVQLPPNLTPAPETLVTTGVTYEAERDTIVLELGGVHFGQPRRQLLRLVQKPNGAGPSGRLDVTSLQCGLYLRVDGTQQPEVLATSTEATPADAAEMRIEVGRNAFVRTLPTVLPETPKPLVKLVSLLEALKGSATAGLLHALWADATGEVKLGVTQANYRKWGRTYFLSLVTANHRQQCNNFKDKSVQCYGGKLFQTLQASGERAFLALPPPVSTCRSARPQSAVSTASSSSSGGGSGTTQTRRQANKAATAAASPKTRTTTSMAWAYNCGGGCVAPQCLVQLAKGATKPAAAVAKGDVLANGAIVACVVRVAVQGGAQAFTSLSGGLLVSPYHPVRLDGKWSFPTDVPTRDEEPVSVDTTHMFSFLLEADERDASPQSMLCIPCHGVDVAPFAHRCADDVPVIGHGFFGSGASREALQQAKGFAAGDVEVVAMNRDPTTMRIVGITTGAE